MKTLLFLLMCFSAFTYAEVTPVLSGRSNPCVEGDFLDIGENQCKKLDKSYGFDESIFTAALPALIVNVSACNEAELQIALVTVKANGGGTINLPACVFQVTGDFVISGNTLLQGMGSEKTIFNMASSTSLDSAILYAKTVNGVKPENVLIRDVGITGPGFTAAGDDITAVILNPVINGLLERVNISGMTKHGCNVAHSQKITVRYLTLQNNDHGCGMKDFFQQYSASLDTNPSNGYLSRAEIDQGSVTFWNDDFAVYSNRSSGNFQYGLDTHVSNMELSGNRLGDPANGQDTVSGSSKIPEPAFNVWVHDNLSINDNKGFSTRTQTCSVTDTDMQTRNVVFYRNRIVNTAQEYGMYNFWSTNIIFADNIYANNSGTNIWSDHSTCNKGNGAVVGSVLSSVSYCPGNQMDVLNVTGNGVLTSLAANDSRCDLALVPSIFNGAP